MNALNALRIHMRRYPQSEPQDWNLGPAILWRRARFSRA